MELLLACILIGVFLAIVHYELNSSLDKHNYRLNHTIRQAQEIQKALQKESCRQTKKLRR